MPARWLPCPGRPARWPCADREGAGSGLGGGQQPTPMCPRWTSALSRGRSPTRGADGITRRDRAVLFHEEAHEIRRSPQCPDDWQIVVGSLRDSLVVHHGTSALTSCYRLADELGHRILLGEPPSVRCAGCGVSFGGPGQGADAADINSHVIEVAAGALHDSGDLSMAGQAVLVRLAPDFTGTFAQLHVVQAISGCSENASLSTTGSTVRPVDLAGRPSSAEIDALRALAVGLARVPGVKRAFIYGSWAARYLGEPGPPPVDVDVLVVGTADRDDLYDVAEAVEPALGREVQIRGVRPETWEYSPVENPFLAHVRVRPLVELDLSAPGTGVFARVKPT